MNDPIRDFWQLLGFPGSPLGSLRFPQPWPTRDAVDEACYQIERQCQADQAEADAQERRRLEDGE